MGQKSPAFLAQMVQFRWGNHGNLPQMDEFWQAWCCCPGSVCWYILHFTSLLPHSACFINDGVYMVRKSKIFVKRDS